FDLGPSILTLPHIFQRLFERSGRQMADYVSIRPVRPHWRNFFEDGMTIDLHPDPAVMAMEAAKAGEDPAAVEAFLRYSAKLYDLVNDGYFEKGLDDTRDFAGHYGFWRSTGFDLLRRMHGGGARFLKTERMRDIFDYFIKYVGSSAYRAPAFMNCLPTIQFRYDLWYVDGGMYGMALALGRLMEELGVEVVLDSRVTTIRKEGNRVNGIQTDDGTFHAADIVVSNVEVIPSYRHLLQEPPEFMAPLEKFEPSCSGLVLELGLDTTYPQLAHHNFFFSQDQRSHFRAVFEEHRLPDDPTIYLVAAGRTDPTVAPPGCDTIKILPHIPHLREDRPLSAADYAAFKERVLDKLERMGLRDIRRHTVVEHLWTPEDILREYGSNCGSIYGVVCDRSKNFGFKPPKRSSMILS
ncbi:MAG: phytoene desaturase, partial [Verrucomicrobiaceae bacterium]